MSINPADPTWKVDAESGIVYREPDDADQPVWYVNYVKNSSSINGVYTLIYGSMGPMLYQQASELFDRLDRTGLTLNGISKVCKEKPN